MPNLTEAPTDVAALVREHTMAEHRSAESETFIVALMRGELSLNDYTRYLAQLAWVYEALEARAHRSDDPSIIDPALDRMVRIEADLRMLDAADWRETHPASSATQAYCTHLVAIDGDDLPRYLAHHYTRYLGDLSGGQAISRLVGRHYGATDEQLSFFRFEEIDDLVHYKRAYRDNLNGLAFTEDETQVFLAEARRAFEFNSAIFTSLGS